MDNLKEMLDLADQGRHLWLELVEQYKISYKTVVFLCPHAESELNSLCIKHAEETLRERKAERGIFFGVRDENEKELTSDRLPLDRYEISFLSRQEMAALLKYNDMVTFSPYVILVSFQYGSDNNIMPFLGYHGITMEELVCRGILGLKDDYMAGLNGGECLG